MSVKTIVTNLSAMRDKYGGSGVKAIRAALTALIGADRSRGIITTVVDLSNPREMAKYDATPVTDRKSAQQNKVAIDGVFNGTDPQFLMILGGPDIVPHQPLTNPLKGQDPDKDIPSDLPYACTAPYSLDPNNFTGPTRFIGRLPDVTGSANPTYLVRLIEFLATLSPAARSGYQAYFGLSALVWQNSTQESLEKVFGNAGRLNISPPSGPNWTNANLAPKSHFVNCHGASKNPNWYGDNGKGNQPVAFTAPEVTLRITPGTMAVAECCYGAQLYEPPAPGAIGICNTYLYSGAVLFFGSTNTSYAPASGNGEADLITQYVLANALGGVTSGQAALQAQQTFVTNTGPNLNPYTIKTLAQFLLLGDPSFNAVSTPAPAIAQPEPDTSLIDRIRQLQLMGRHLERNVSVPERIDDTERGAELDAQLAQIVAQRGLRSPTIVSYAGRWKGDAELLEIVGTPPRYHVLQAGQDPATVVVVREQAGRIVAIEELRSLCRERTVEC